MLECRCRGVFEGYVRKEYEQGAPEMSIKLLSAFEAGTVAAKKRLDASACRFNALTNGEEFLAWYEGFKCCDAPKKDDRR